MGWSGRSWEGQVIRTNPRSADRLDVARSQRVHEGRVSFHPLADDLTRVMVVMEYTPVGPVERIGDMMRLQLRLVRLDLREYKKFIREYKKFISMRNAEPGA